MTRSTAPPGSYLIDPRLDPAETESLRAQLDGGGWTPTPDDGRDGDWNLFWCGAVHDLEVFAALDDTRLVNHFPGIGPFHYKDELARFLAASGHEFHPATFSMPWQLDELVAAMAADPDAVWVRKRKRGWGGEGMAIFTGGDEIPTDEPWIVQRYVADPLLLPGRPFKHVLRRYVVLTSLDPLEAWVHTGGPVKFTSRPYDPSPSAFDDPFVHVTNPPVQARNPGVADPVRSIGQDEYRGLLAAAGIDGGALFARIDGMLGDTVVALHEPVLALSREWTPRIDRCFELLGFDVLVDADLNPWLLECNVGPALRARGRPGSSHHDAQRRAKEALVADLLRLVGLIGGPHGFAPLRATAERGSPDRHHRRRSR